MAEPGGGHHELDCITQACCMYETVLDEAMNLAGEVFSPLSGEDELRTVMPTLLAQLSPDARAMLADHLDHVRELVAFVHRMTARYEIAANRSSA